MFPGLPRFLRSSASVYYTEHKPKNKKRGRPGNEANSSPLPVSGGGAVGSMLDWHNGAGPSLSHGWRQCQHIDFVCKWPSWHGTNKLTPCPFNIQQCEWDIAHGDKYTCYVGHSQAKLITECREQIFLSRQVCSKVVWNCSGSLKFQWLHHQQPVHI